MKRVEIKWMVMGLGLLAGSFSAMHQAAACCSPPPKPTCAVQCNDPSKCNVVIGGTVAGTIGPPAQCSCASGRTVPANLTVSASAVVDDAGNPVGGFNGFQGNGTTAAAFAGLAAPPPGQSWVGFNSSVGDLPVGATGNLVFTVTSRNPIDPTKINDGSYFGVAQADVKGGNFNPGHQSVAKVPMDCEICPAGKVQPGVAMSKLCTTVVAAAPVLAAAEAAGDIANGPSSNMAGGCTVGHRGSYGAAALLLACVGLALSRRRRAT